MTPHRFRHTLATDLMKQPERNIHLTKSLLNHSNLATTMNYIEADYDHMRAVLHERSRAQGALSRVTRVDPSGKPSAPLPAKIGVHSQETAQPEPKKLPAPQQSSSTEVSIDRRTKSTGRSALQKALELASAQLHRESMTCSMDPPVDQVEQSLLLTLMASGLGVGTFRKRTSTEHSMRSSSFSRASP